MIWNKILPTAILFMALPFLAAAQVSPGGILQFSPSVTTGTAMLPFQAQLLSLQDPFGKNPPAGALSVVTDTQNNPQVDITVNPSALPGSALRVLSQSPIVGQRRVLRAHIPASYRIPVRFF